MYEVIISVAGHLTHTHWTRGQIDENKLSGSGIPCIEVG